MQSSELESAHSAQEEHWIPLSDLMTGLMAMFLLISVLYMTRVEIDASRIRDVAVAYSENRDALYEQLESEFHRDLIAWHAELDREQLSIRFTEPEVLFATGSSELKPNFKAILDDFFPRYLRILTSDRYRQTITEVRIEGHTSSVWNQATSDDDAYFRNMALSQERTRSTLSYVIGIPAVERERRWLKQYVTANGLSSSKPILAGDGTEDRERSQRVEFKVRTDAELRIAKILALQEE
jgi:outer membrane protein OmpA-like peptidoglycan-associated protein